MRRNRTKLALAAAVAGIACAATSARADWSGATTGGTAAASGNTYNLVGNWNGGAGPINDKFSTAWTSSPTIYFNADRTTTGDFTNSATGSMTFSGGGTNGPTTASAHTLTLSGNLNISSASNTITFGNTSVATSALNVDLGGQTRTFNITGTAGLGAAFGNNVSNGGILKTGIGLVAFNNQDLVTGTPSTVTGPAKSFLGILDVAQGTVNINSRASISTLDIRIRSTAGVNTGLSYASALTSLSDANSTNKIADTATISLYSVNQSQLASFKTITNTAGLTITEQIGTLSLRTGLGLLAHGAGSASTTSSTLTTTIGTGGAGGLVRDNKSLLYVNPSVAAANNLGTANNKVFIDNGLSLLKGATPAGTTDLKIIPFAMGSTTGGSTADSFATYDAVNGLRVLGTAEFVSTPTAGQNVRATAAVSITNDITVNSLIQATNAAVTITAGKTLTVTTGAIYAQNGITGGSVNFNGNEGIIRLTSQFATTDSTFTNTGGNGITYFGEFSNGAFGMRLAGTQSYTGPTTFVSGGALNNATALTGAVTAIINSSGALPSTTTVNLHPGTALQFGNTATNQTNTVTGLAGGSTGDPGLVRLFNAVNQQFNIGSGGGTAGKVTLSAGGIITPGLGANSSTTSIGTLGVGNNFSSAAIDLNITGGTYQVDLLGTTNDLLTDTGTTTIAAAGTTLDIRTGTFNPTDGQQWTILTAASVAGTTSAPFATITDDNAGFDFSAAIVGGNSVVLTASAVVPEPASVGLLGLGALAMLGRRGRRKDR